MNEQSEQMQTVKPYKERKYKHDLIDAVIAKSKKGDILSHGQVKRLVNLIFNEIIDMTENDCIVVVTGFGTFEKTSKSPRSYVTPQGNRCFVEGYDKLTFKSSDMVLSRFSEKD